MWNAQNTPMVRNVSRTNRPGGRTDRADETTGRDDRMDHANVEIQLRSSRSPASADFSGWNCVADSGPRS